MKKPGGILTLAAVLTGSALSGACSDDATSPPIPGTVLVALTTPAADDGALLVSISGPGIAGIQPANSSYGLFWRMASADEIRIIMMGNLSAGPLFTLEVADVNDLRRYRPTILEIAGRDDSLRDVAGYRLTMAALGPQ